ncbi:MAG: DUF1127 domain-containing protein [Octadecabacter sp.]|nr:DUF1127 domain-containing protein [Octadecabacter sp.]
MAHLSDTGIIGTSVFSKLINLRDLLTARYVQYQTYSKTLRELESLSKRELNDLGLNQHTLQAVAREAAYGSA